MALSRATRPVASMIGTAPERQDDHARAVAHRLRWRSWRAAPRRRRAARRSRRRSPRRERTCVASCCDWGARTRVLVSSDMRFMKSSAASTTPTPMATTMSKTTVRTKQVSEHRDVAPRRDAHGVHEVAHVAHVPGHEEEQRGQRRHRHVGHERRGDEDRREHEQRVDHRRERATWRRRGCWSPCARAPRWRRCPRRTAPRCCRCPRPTSSRVRDRASCRSCASAMTAESSDSMAPSMAMASAGASSSRTFAKRHPLRAPRQHRAAAAPAGCRPRRGRRPTVWKRVPMVATWKRGRQRAPGRSTPMATSDDGDERRGDGAWSMRGQREQERQRDRRHAELRRATRRRARPRARSTFST